MIRYFLAFNCGVISFLFAFTATHDAFYFACPLFIIVAVFVAKLRLAAAFFCGLCFAQQDVQRGLDAQLPRGVSGEVFWVEGVVESVKRMEANSTVATIKTSHVSEFNGKSLALQRVRLSYFPNKIGHSGATAAFEFDPSNRCAFYARLKTPHGVRNPGVFDKEKFFFRHRIDAAGYIVLHPRNRCTRANRLTSVHDLTRHVRQSIQTSIIDALGYRPATAIVLALAIGEQSLIDDTQWQLLRDTGTAHLVAISGLHLSFVAGIVFVFTRILFSLLPVAKRQGSYRFASLSAFLVAFCYAGLANFSLPTVRALLMLGVATIALFTGRRIFTRANLVVAMTLLLLIDPRAPLSAGFWLSISCVALLGLLANRRGHEHFIRKSARAHCLLSVAILPLVVALQNSAPIASAPANLLTVPLVSLLMLPTILVGVLATIVNLPVAAEAWTVAASIWALATTVLHFSVGLLPAIEVPASPRHAQYLLAGFAVIALLVPLWRWRWLFAGACLMGLFVNSRAPISPGDFTLRVLDVGQGLAVTIETANHVLLYDTGATFRSYDAGKAIVVPALKSLGIKRLDHVVISHLDNDHVGGLDSVAAALPIDRLLVNGTANNADSDPTSRAIDFSTASRCDVAAEWVWDNVAFKVLHPRVPDSRDPKIDGSRISSSKNNRSCVLKITGRHGSALLPGDIEAPVERRLLGQIGDVSSTGSLLSADIIIAPHHGSDTSSSLEFVTTVAAEYAVFAVGFENRYGMPHLTVINRYHHAGTQMLSTSDMGMLNFFVTKSGIHTASYRRQQLRLWHHPPTIR